MVAAAEIKPKHIGQIKNYHSGKDEETPEGCLSTLQFLEINVPKAAKFEIRCSFGG